MRKKKENGCSTNYCATIRLAGQRALYTRKQYSKETQSSLQIGNIPGFLFYLSLRIRSQGFSKPPSLDSGSLLPGNGFPGFLEPESRVSRTGIQGFSNRNPGFLEPESRVSRTGIQDFSNRNPGFLEPESRVSRPSALGLRPSALGLRPSAFGLRPSALGLLRPHFSLQAPAPLPSTLHSSSMADRMPPKSTNLYIEESIPLPQAATGGHRGLDFLALDASRIHENQ